MLKISNKVSKFYYVTCSIKFFFPHKRIGNDKPLWLESEAQFVNLDSGGGE